MVETSYEHREKEPIKVSKIKLLIHPGFGADPNFYHKNSAQEQTPESEMDQAAVDKSIQKYVPVAEGMGSDELMLAFLHKKTPLVKTDKKQGAKYLKVIEEVKNILGDRLIVLSDAFPVTKESEEGVEAAKQAFRAAMDIAKARGYVLDENVESAALGEYLDDCVANGYINFKQARVTRGKTEILKDSSL